MTDEELVTAFESGTLDAKLFPHEAHGRVAWWYVRRHTVADALSRFSAALRRFAEINGASGKYHETITVAYLALIAERVDASPTSSWSQFIDAYPELLDRGLLHQHYAPATLESGTARRVFVLPRRG